MDAHASATAETLDDARVELAGLVAFPERCEVVRRGRVVRLGEKECRVLVMLLRARGRVVGLRELLQETWGADDPGGAGKVRGVVQRLRAKLRTPNCILTIGGEGYCIDMTPPQRG
jgi:two-component system KDP operon response regulator KdpE